MNADYISIITTIIASAIGLAGFFWGLITYREGQNLKRKDILFPLIEEFTKSCTIALAQQILDDYYINPRNGWAHASKYGYYHKGNLKYILKKHDVDDPGEVAIRQSFDALLDFFIKLEYLLNINLIKEEELSYFQYYIKKAAKEGPVMQYIKDYDFPLHIHRLTRSQHHKRYKILPF